MIRLFLGPAAAGKFANIPLTLFSSTMFCFLACGSKEGGFVPAGGFAYAVWSYCVLLFWPAAARKEGLSLPGASLTLFGLTVFCCFGLRQQGRRVCPCRGLCLRCLVLLCFVFCPAAAGKEGLSVPGASLTLLGPAVFCCFGLR
jgi:hypothetical protein